MKATTRYEVMSPFEFKNILLKQAEKSCADSPEARVFNAGRGNPNFLNTTVRDAFSAFHYAMTALADQGNTVADLGVRPSQEGIAKQLIAYLEKHPDLQGRAFLMEAIAFAEVHCQCDADALVFELGDAILGDFYPMPSRVFPLSEKILNAYLARILTCKAHVDATSHFDLFATEGATMAMVYIFNTLKENRLLNAGDHIAIVTPIFSPYLEIPELADYALEQVHIETTAETDWQISDQELEKLKDPKVKALFMVNPANPSGVSLNLETLKKITTLVKKERPNLIVITDTVYASFVEDFHSIAYDLPKNTICCYSFSKYFGVTGWRLGLVMVHDDNQFDAMIQALPEKTQKELDARYCTDFEDTRHIKFIDRLEADSRSIALAHTGGLSGPQQAIMVLFSLFELMDTQYAYKQKIQAILKRRVALLSNSLEAKLLSGPYYSNYYVLLDLISLASEKHGVDFADDFQRTISVFDFLLRLAKETATVCLPAQGFAGPELSIRLSMANLNDADYSVIGQNIADVMARYHEAYLENKST